LTLSSEIIVKEATDADSGRWNAYLDAIPGVSPLARYEWRSILSNTYNVPTFFLIAETAGKIIGVFGGYEVSDFGGARRFFSLRSGGVANDGASATAMRSWLQDKAAERRWADAVLTTGDRDWGGQGAEILKKTIQLDIDADEKKMWSGLRGKTRNMIRRAEQNGITVVTGHQHIKTLYNHYRENMTHLGVTLHVENYFNEVIQQLGYCTEILVATHQQKPIASMLLHFGRDFACYPVQNAAREARNLAPVQRLNWEAMKLCGARGIRCLDMGESGQNSPVYQSKVNFGGRPADLHYYRLSGGGPEAGPIRLVTKTFGRAVQAGCNVARHAAPDRLRPLVLECLHRRGRLL